MRYFIFYITTFVFFITLSVSAHALSDDDMRAIDLNAPIYYGEIGVGGSLGCVGAGFNLDVGPGFSLGPMDNHEERQANLVQALVGDFGITPEQAAGIVGNFAAETGVNLPPNVNETLSAHPETSGPGPPRLVFESSGGGYGWAQWTGGRKENFVNFAVDNGYVESDQVDFNDAANYAFLKEELTNTAEAVAIERIQNHDNPRDAANNFMLVFERPGVERVEEREDAAEQALVYYQQRSGSGPSDTADRRCPGSARSAAISGDYAFPLITTQGEVFNPADPAFSLGGEFHGYLAYDLFASPGTEVVAFLGGVVTRRGTDICGGRTIHVYNEDEDLSVAYMHLEMETTVTEGDVVLAGDSLGFVGGSDAACGTQPHLHIDASIGESRPGCSGEGCPGADQFVDIGPQLYETFQQLPE